MTDITLQPGQNYIARLHGGALDGADWPAVASDGEPSRLLQVATDTGVVLYEWNGFLAQSGCGAVSAGYSHCTATVA